MNESIHLFNEYIFFVYAYMNKSSFFFIYKGIDFHLPDNLYTTSNFQLPVLSGINISSSNTKKRLKQKVFLVITCTMDVQS